MLELRYTIKNTSYIIDDNNNITQTVTSVCCDRICTINEKCDCNEREDIDAIDEAIAKGDYYTSCDAECCEDIVATVNGIDTHSN